MCVILIHSIITSTFMLAPGLFSKQCQSNLLSFDVGPTLRTPGPNANTSQIDLFMIVPVQACHTLSVHVKLLGQVRPRSAALGLQQIIATEPDSAKPPAVCMHFTCSAAACL